LKQDVIETYHRLVDAQPGLERRAVQETMLTAVAETIHDGGSLLVEAGTGAGKSFGYLLPALLSKQRPIVISTGTIALQEQLLHKDIPALQSSSVIQHALGHRELKVTLVKGRRNYLCIQKMMELEGEIRPNTAESLQIDRLKAALTDGWDGDKNTLDFSVGLDFWQEVQSESEDCLNQRCRFYQENPYRLAREDLAESDIIIANHALYFQDLAAGQTLLPPHDVVIFDEAHHLKRYATGAFTARIGKFSTTKLLQKIRRRLRAVPDDYIQQIAEGEAALMHWLFRQYGGEPKEGSKLSKRLIPDIDFLTLVVQQLQALKTIYEWLSGMTVTQLSVTESDAEQEKRSTQKKKLLEQLKGLIDRWGYFALQDPDSESRVNWITLDKERLFFELHSTPLNLASFLAEDLWPEKTAILTSATLAVNGHLNFTRQDLGLPDTTRQLVLDSPFNYREQCALYLPKGLPDPNSFQFQLAITEEIAAIVNATQGRAFVLFTSIGQMKKVADALIPHLPFPCRVQGELPRSRLIEWFQESGNGVLFATATFWEGIDIPGEALSCVIMDKIPFSPPDDPVNQAMIEHFKKTGQDWFNGLVLPEATIKLKQGFGRLIRSKDDTGLVAILDPRLTEKGYGKRVIRSLPDVQTIHQLTEFSLPSIPNLLLEAV